ncbi:ATP-binding protein [Hymenobacter sp. YC55]|uniref:sensor histidine kinase n=1 Tax=Hymenobacter sp. YC55 TaxID=3034019 RepID=UPI0023F74DAF|nr:ATP-binding protein [Hymenobacter sp. YC55]MDF7812473.1 ATP-binding protein [Hymenobacter sp. YC55]
MPNALLPFLLIGPILLLLVAGIVGIVVREQRRRLRQEQEKHQILARQNEVLEQQVQQRTADLQQSLLDLKATQRQLIQSEKLASLGELTAGVAHEIQNPLNFVNNFSEICVELVQEVKEEVLTQLPNGQKPLVVELLDSLEGNLERITLHGRRADSIVKGMLLHARNTSVEREPTDLSVLADQYLRLAYQGIRAKKKDFNVILTTHYAAEAELITVAAQDMGRVLTNLFNNAFYALQKKQERNEAGYEAEIRVSTQVVNQQFELRIWDNGTGIPAAVEQKIYQPFFTTKPTGEGTGLGLSLSYDIITKGHGGTLSFETKEGQYTEFIVRLPLQTIS